MSETAQTGEATGDANVPHEVPGETLESVGSAPQEGQPKDQETTVPFNYKEYLPEDLRSEKMFESVPDFETLAKNYVHAQKAIGSSIRVPGEDASPEEWDKVYSKLGRPDGPDSYDITPPKFDEDSGLSWDGEAQQKFAQAMHQAGLNNKQLQSALDWYGDYMNEFAENRNGSAVEAARELQEEWGGAYERKIQLAQRAVVQIGGQGLKDKLDAHGLLNDVSMVKAFVEMGELLAQDGIIIGEAGGISDRESAKSKIAAIRNDPNHSYHKPGDPDHTRSVEEMKRLYQLAYD